MPASAIIFEPGLSGGGLDQSAGGIADRLAQALNATAPAGEGGDRSATFIARTTGQIAFGEGRTAGTARVSRVSGGSEEARLDIYVLNDLRDAVSTTMDRPVWANLFLVLLSLISGIAKLRHLMKPSEGRRGMAIAALWATLVLSLLSLHFVLLASSLLITLVEATEQGEQIVSSTLPVWLATAAPFVALSLLAFNTFIRPFLPKDLRQSVAETAAGWMVMVGYLDGRVRRSRFVGGIASLIDHWADEGVAYDDVHLVGYSMGAVVVADTAFNPGPFEAFRTLHSVTTIGFPHDTIAVFWPGYFAGREDTLDLGRRWCNIAVTGDPISSDFAAGRERGIRATGNRRIRPAVTVTERQWGEPTRGTLLDHLLANGVTRLHTSYWDSDQRDPGCWLAVVPHLLARSAVFLGSARYPGE